VYGQYNFTPKLNVHLDLQARNEYTDGDWFNWLVRTGLSYKINNGVVFSAGIAYFKLYPNPNGLPPRPEWRPWQEVGKKFIKNKHTFYPRFRVEQRFIKEYVLNDLDDHFSLNTFRWRLRLDYAYNFKPVDEKGLLLLAGYEYLFNTKPDGKSYFDQNRVTAGFGYQLNSQLMLQVMYLNLFLRKGTNSFEQHHIARFTLVARFAKQKKEKS
jgi:long-subunit fatty acid transport protein